MANFYGGLTRASATLSVGADPIAGDTVTIGDITYLFATDPTGEAFEVDVGTDRDDSINNLVAAINLSGTDDDEYGAGTTENPYVTAAAVLADDNIVLTAKIPGTYGNGITVDTSETDILFDDTAVTLEGGAGDLGDVLDEALDVLQLNSEVIAFLRHISPASD